MNIIFILINLICFISSIYLYKTYNVSIVNIILQFILLVIQILLVIVR